MKTTAIVHMVAQTNPSSNFHVRGRRNHGARTRPAIASDENHTTDAVTAPQPNAIRPAPSNGEVMGCVSVEARAAQGCKVEYLGRRDYRMLATQELADQWFPDGLTAGAVRRTPLVVFNRKDRLHDKLFRRALRRARVDPPVHYIPSPEPYLAMITSGLAYGIVPDLQGEDLVDNGELVDLSPDHAVRVDLYWHCWNLRSQLLDELSAAIVDGAREMLPQR